jgi:hypothetical protein
LKDFIECQVNKRIFICEIVKKVLNKEEKFEVYENFWEEKMFILNQDFPLNLCKKLCNLLYYINIFIQFNYHLYRLAYENQEIKQFKYQ